MYTEQENNVQTIVCAAVRFGHWILCSAKHWDHIMDNQAQMIGGKSILKAYGKEEQGFIDQFGNFLDRKEAIAVMKKTGQKFDVVRNGGHTELFSKGLY